VRKDSNMVISISYQEKHKTLPTELVCDSVFGVVLKYFWKSFCKLSLTVVCIFNMSLS